MDLCKEFEKHNQPPVTPAVDFLIIRVIKKITACDFNH